MIYNYNEFEYEDLHCIMESNHFSDIFKECINDILQNKSKYQNKYCNTGWYYDNKSYSVNKNNIGKPIYLNITEINSYGQFIYEKGKILIKISNALNNYRFKATLQHELIHAVKSHSSDYNDNLNNLKDNIAFVHQDYIKEFNIEDKNITKTLFTLFHSIAPSEQESSINAVCKFILSINEDTLKTLIKDEYNRNKNKVWFNNVLSKYTQLTIVMTYSKEIHYLSNLLYITDNFKKLDKSIIFLIGYYLKKHKLYTSKSDFVKYDYVYDMLHDFNDKNLSHDEKIEAVSIYKQLRNLISDYKKKLYNAVYAIMDKNKLFLSYNTMIEQLDFGMKLLYENGLKY